MTHYDHFVRLDRTLKHCPPGGRFTLYFWCRQTPVTSTHSGMTGRHNIAHLWGRLLNECEMANLKYPDYLDRCDSTYGFTELTSWAVTQILGLD